MLHLDLAAGGHIIRDFDDPYLELVRLLREASEIEHALLVQYLYASFSVKQRYDSVIGTGLDDSVSLVGVAVQEMHHLARVNEMLRDLRAAPNLIRQDFPYEPDIYPFELSLEPLSRRSVAKYLYAEAPAAALDPDNPQPTEPAEFVAAVQDALGGAGRPNHIGSLYGEILDRLQDVIDAGLPGLPDLNPWKTTLHDIRINGEDDHYQFFRSLFTGEALGATPQVWTLDPGDDAYPALDIGTDRSAFRSHPRAIPQPQRATGWLANLHYWLVLCLLDLRLRTVDANGALGTQARKQMTTALRPLGTHLATQGVGVPLDPLSMGYAPGHDTAGTVFIVRRLVAESAAAGAALAPTLPTGLAARLATLATSTLTALDAVAPVAPPATVGAGTVTGTSNQDGAAATATEFWFDFDNGFHYAPNAAVKQAMAGLNAVGGMDGLLDLFTQRVDEKTVATTYPGDVAVLRTSLTTLSSLQLAAFDAHFAGDENQQRDAFERFGQGDLFDQRRPGNEVHMMDTGALPPIGYHRWRAIQRAMVVLDIDAARWTTIGKHTALAWAIQSEARPRQGTHNPPMAPTRLAVLRSHWLALSDDDIDAAFAAGSYAPTV